MSEEPKKIEIVSGNKNDLEISEVSTYLNIAKPRIKDDQEKKEKIVIPQAKKKGNEENDNKSDENKNEN